ncbi:MAG: CoA ester lyase [Ottowia sp.]|uniref:HpcH/HpaI aldolase/citrate lyase family protein n=1 Tax=Ottowia sp. TaxID=1898956 RepID=UPI003C7474B2
MSAPIRSLLFAPANRPDLLAKLPRFPADCYVLDLEDGTPPEEKARARELLAQTIPSLRSAGLPGMLTVRVNKPDSEHHHADIEAALAADADGLVLPKLEQAGQLISLVNRLRQPGTAVNRQRFVIGGIESVRGVIHAVDVCSCAPEIVAVYFGAEDFIADIGGRRTRAGREAFHARSQVIMAAKAAGIQAIDQAVVDIRDEALFREDSEQGRDLGYDGKICVAPRQAQWANALFSPTAEEIQEAEHMLAAYDEALARGVGTIEFKGRMIDPPLLQRARHVLALAASGSGARA